MKRSSILYRISLSLIVLLATRVWSSSQAGTQERGQGVRIKTESGQELDLYAASHALVIGVSDYTNGWRKLPGVRADVEAVGGLLRQQGFQVETLLNPTGTQLDDALRTFISNHGLAERNRLLVYFAGHGYTETLGDGRDRGYVVPADAPLPEREPRLFNRRALSMDDMESHALRIKSKHALFIFDSCFSGSIFETRSERRTPPEIESKTASPVRQFITSGTKNQQVPDDSIFRLYFVRAFAQREGDLNGDGYVTGEELGMYLTGRVAGDSRDTQTPRFGKIKDARLNIGDFVFALPKRELPVAPPVPVPLEDRCAVAWRAIERSERIETVERFLQDCKNSAQAFAAQLRLDELKARRSVAGVPLTAVDFVTANVNASGQVINRRTEECLVYVEDLGNGVKLEMVEIAGGTFEMGSPESEAMRSNAEGPVHRVTLKGFLMGRHEVTQAQWQAVMGGLPPGMSDLKARFKGDSLPVVRVSWEEAKEFCDKLNAKLRLDKGSYRLPSEAEWEYAARAGTQTAYAFGPTITPAVVNYDGNYPHGGAAKGEYRARPVAVGSLGLANAWGLFDMHGNVWEWCEDNWHGRYSGAPSDGRAWVDGSSTGASRVLRGGGWRSGAVDCRSAYRNGHAPGARSDGVGFRLVRIGR